MKILILEIAFVMSSINLYSQEFKDYFSLAVKEFQNGNLGKADSLFTLSINAALLAPRASASVPLVHLQI